MLGATAVLHTKKLLTFVNVSELGMNISFIKLPLFSINFYLFLKKFWYFKYKMEVVVYQNSSFVAVMSDAETPGRYKGVLLIAKNWAFLCN